MMMSMRLQASTKNRIIQIPISRKQLLNIVKTKIIVMITEVTTPNMITPRPTKTIAALAITRITMETTTTPMMISIMPVVFAGLTALLSIRITAPITLTTSTT